MNSAGKKIPRIKTSPPPEGPGVGSVIRATILMESPIAQQNPIIQI